MCYNIRTNAGTEFKNDNNNKEDEYFKVFSFFKKKDAFFKIQDLLFKMS